jgi:transcriptional regulator with XRE-family HTH domain
VHEGSLGAALRALRKASEKEAKAVARGAVMSVSKLSKIETGKLSPSVADVERILTALGVSEEVKSEYLAVARQAATETTAWRIIRRTGVHRAQEQTRALESRMTRLKLFQPALIPGLLQTPEYMRTILSRHGLTEDVLHRTVRSRLERQRVLYDAGKDLRFLITENVFRWRIVSPTRLAEQIDRVVSLSRLPHVDIGVVPFSAAQNDIANHAFVIRDDRTVTVETVHAEVVVTDSRDVSLYLEKFAGFAAVALRGAEMRRMLEKIRDELLTERENG